MSLKKKGTCSFISVSYRHLLSTYCIPGTVLDAEEMIIVTRQGPRKLKCHAVLWTRHELTGAGDNRHPSHFFRCPFNTWLADLLLRETAGLPHWGEVSPWLYRNVEALLSTESGLHLTCPAQDGSPSEG